MRRLLMIGLVGAALTGCATPNYPISQGYVPPPPIRPTYAVSQATRAAPETVAGETRNAAAQAESAPAGSAAAPAPAPVESAPLAPIATSPSVTTAPAASPPASTPASPAPSPQSTPAAASPPVSAPPPAPVYEPPVRRRESEVRYSTDGKVVTPRGMYRDYEVQKGDHIDAIARDLNTTREELVRANRLKKPYQIVPGQHLKVPVAKAYVAVSGDTMAGVAKRFGVGLGELSALNDLGEHARLSSGMSIALPSRYTDHGPARTVVSRDVYETPRPKATYKTEPSYPRPANPAPSYQASGGPYVPSAAALAAAAAHKAAASQTPSSTESAARPPVYSPAPSAPAPSAAAVVQLGQGKFIWPVRGQILSAFGDAGMGRRNDGIDIGAPAGSEVKAAAVGEVVYAGDQVPGFGNLVLVKHADGWVSAYAHLATINVRMRDTVYQGQVLGTVGETGGVSTPQLHFELRYAATAADKAKPVDPTQVLPK